MDKNTCCQICMKEFFKVSNLRRHIKKFHPDNFEPLPKKKFEFTCDVCGKNFSYLRNYRSHMKIHDPNPPQTKILKKCPLCNFISEKTELYEHFNKDHDTRLETEQLNFKDTKSFMDWKMSLENQTQSHFIRSYTQQTKYYNEVILFVCDRSGHYLPKNKSLEKVKTESITKKIGGFCPANIKMMKKNDGSITVSFLQTHIGHPDQEVDVCGESTKKMKNILLRHKNSCKLSTNSLVKTDNAWQFHSQNIDEIYVISAQDDRCSLECPLTCQYCKACIHRYSCSCKDWSVKWNMCIHIHLLCRLLDEEQDKKPEQILADRTGSSLDITDLIIYEGGGSERSVANECKSGVIIHEMHTIPPGISIEEKNIILQEFSDILLKCNSPRLFQEIVSIVGGLKARVGCEEF